MRFDTLTTLSFLLGFSIAVSGCVPFLHSGGIDRTIDAPYDRVFAAAAEELRVRGFPLEEIDRADGRIVTGRRPMGVGTARAPRPVEQVEVELDDDGARTDVHLFLRFVDQVSGPPRRVPDDGDDDRADDVFDAALSRSFDADAMYDAYFDAIEARALRGGS